MAKFTVTRLLDVSKTLTTQVGQQIPDFFRYMAQFVEQAVLNLRGGLTFQDNFACDVKVVTLVHAVAQNVTTSRPNIVGAWPVRVASTSKMIDAFSWYIDTNGKFTVVANFADVAGGSQVGVSANVTLVVLF